MSKSLNSTFTYKITQYDVANQWIRVEYGDGSWAQIDLLVPLPQTREELEEIIAQYTAPMEHQMAISQDAPAAIIQELLNKDLEAERRYALPPDPVVTDTDVDPVDAERAVHDFDELSKEILDPKE